MTIHPQAHGFEPPHPSNRRDFVTELSDAVRENPVPAALIGMGVLWMFIGGSRTTLLGDASRSLLSGLGQGAQQIGRTAYRGAEGVGAGMSSAASGVAETAKEAGSLFRTATRSAADAARDTLSDASTQAAGAVKATGTVQHTLAKMFEKQPLLLGAVGLAVGAAIAASIPVTDAENRFMGETADSVKEHVQDLVTEKTKQAEALATKGLAEAKAQGLTPAAAGEALRGVTEKIASVVETAGRGVTRKLDSAKPKDGADSV